MKLFRHLFSLKSKCSNDIAEEILLLRRSGLVDPVWYRYTYSDLRDTPIDVARHYLEHGANEGRNPHPLFDTNFYVSQNPDLTASGLNPLVHYLLHGGREGRDPHPHFNTEAYLRRNPDVKATGLTPLQHYTQFGWRAGTAASPPFDPPEHEVHIDASQTIDPLDLYSYRKAKDATSTHSKGAATADQALHRASMFERMCAIFDPGYYREQGYQDHADPLEHYLSIGFSQNLTPSVLFDSNLYRSDHKLSPQENPLLHYLEGGWRDALRTHDLFHNRFYLDKYLSPSSEIDPLSHYILFGSKLGHMPNPLFDTTWYLAKYADVAKSDANPLVHFIKHGESEGRRPNAYFFTSWYREQYHGIMKPASPLADYLHHAFLNVRRPNEAFDAEWYLSTNEDVRSSGTMPFEHFLWHGAKEGRDPGPTFDTRYYVRTNPDVSYFENDPLFHYLQWGKKEGRFGKDPYPEWVEAFGRCTDDDRRSMRTRIAEFEVKPVISILCPVYNTDLTYLDCAINSVLRQIYPHWELCLADNASTNPGVVKRLNEYLATDARIKLCARSVNGHIAANTNSALSLATGGFVAFLDSDDELTEDALFWIANEINVFKDVDIIFSDEDKIDISNNRYEPYFKSDWNPALMLSQNAVCHFNAIRRTLLDKVGWLRQEFNGSQDHELVLRCARSVPGHHIRHIPRILYHWRAAETSTALVAGGKSYAWDAGRMAILEHLDHCGASATVERSSTGHYRVLYDFPSDEPAVSILMPSACKLELVRPCLLKLFERTDYRNFEIVLMVSDVRFAVREQAAFLEEIASHPNIRLNIYEDRPFNFSRLNNEAFRLAKGDYIVFMNDDIEIITSDWIQQLLARIRLDNVGMVGPLLRYPSGHVQHAGVVLGIGGVADHPFRFVPRGDGGYFGRALLEQDVSCVTAACAMMRTSLFSDLGGYDETLAVAFNDVDLCLRLRQHGQRIIWAPEVEMIHHESASLGVHNSAERKKQFDREVDYIKTKLGRELDEDPFYNPNLSLVSGRAFQLAFPPRIKRASELWSVATTDDG